MAAERSVQARWDGGMRAVVTAGEFEMIVDEPESVAGGTNKGPQPTEMLLASVASCFTLAMAFSAAKRGVELSELNVEATGRYDGPRFSRITVTVTAAEPRGEQLQRLMAAAGRVCYVTRTLTMAPEIEIVAT